MKSFALYLVIASIVFFLFFRKEFSNKVFWFVFVSKFLLSSCYFLLYKYYYKIGDVFSYDSLMDSLNQYAELNPISYLKFVCFGLTDDWILGIKELDFGNMPFARFNALFHLLSGGNMAVTSFYYSTFLFCFGWKIYSNLKVKDQVLSKAFFVTFYLIPSLSLWTSGFAKEGLICIMLQFLFSFQFKFYDRKSINWVIAVFVCLFMLRLRHFVALAFVLQFVLFLLYDNGYFNTTRKKVFSIIGFLSLLILTISAAQLLFEISLPIIIYAQYLKFFKQTDFEHFITLSLDLTWVSLLKNIPLAFLKGWLMPYPIRGGSLPYFIMGIENCIMLILMFFSMIKTSGKEFVSANAILFYILLLSILLPLVAPEVGALVRYKTAYIPLVWIFIVYKLNSVVLKSKTMLM